MDLHDNMSDRQFSTDDDKESTVHKEVGPEDISDEIPTIKVIEMESVNTDRSNTQSRRGSIFDSFNLRMFRSSSVRSSMTSFKSILPILRRDSTLTDISRQTSLQDLFIRMDHRDNLMTKISPNLSARMMNV